MNRTLFGLHVPKSAGTSLLSMIEGGVQSHQVYQCTSFHKNFVQGRPEFLEIRRHDVLKAVWGHFVHEEMIPFFENPYVFTYLREPEERLKSQYRFLARHWRNLGHEVPSPDAWLLKKRKNDMSHFIVSRFPKVAGTGTLVERAKNVLNAFDFVGFSENFAKTAPQIVKIIGVSSQEIRTNTTETSEDTLHVPEKFYEVDKCLYDWAYEKFSSDTPNPNNDRSKEIKKMLGAEPCLDTLTPWLARHYLEEANNFGYLEKLRKFHSRALAWNQEVYGQ